MFKNWTTGFLIIFRPKKKSQKGWKIFETES